MLSIIQIPQESSVTLTASQYESLCVVQQLKRSFSPGNRLGALIALCIGSFVPTASFEIVHFETLSNRWMWILVAGALLFSATSVFGLAQAAFHSGVKGAGFCVLVEGVMVLSHCHWLSVAALALLITINVASASCALQVQPDSVTSDSGMQSLGRTQPNVTVNIAQQNITTPERTPSRSKDGAERRAADAARARRYRQRKKQASVT